MKHASLVAGLGYGDEGKGATVDFLCRRLGANLVVRYNGGPQAGHNVVTADGRHHTFSQFGSGTFVPGVRTHLSRFMLINPISMMAEEEHLRELGVDDAFDRLTVSRHCVVVTPFHRAVNRIEQFIRNRPNNSCGQGVGIARLGHLTFGREVLLAGDLLDTADTIIEKLQFVRGLAREAVRAIQPFGNFDKVPPEELSALYNDDYIDACMLEYEKWPARIIGAKDFAREIDLSDAVVFEGAQGVLLDETHGELGFNTWTDTTFNNAVALLNECRYTGEVKKIGVIRTYSTRHGSGPLRLEREWMRDSCPEPHNDGDGMQGNFRVGLFDLEAFESAIKICGGVDTVALNHIDVMPDISRAIAGLVTIRGWGPTAEDRTMT